MKNEKDTYKPRLDDIFIALLVLEALFLLFPDIKDYIKIVYDRLMNYWVGQSLDAIFNEGE